MSHLATKQTKWSVRPAKTQISLGIHPVWSEFSLSTQWVAKDPRFLHTDSKDSDQTGRMPRLIWVFAGCTVILLVLSWGSSYGKKDWIISQYFCKSIIFANTGHSRYVDFAYLDTTTCVEVIFHSQHFSLYFFAFQLRLCRKRLPQSNGYLKVIFYALDVFASVYVEVLNRRSHGCHIVCFGYVHILAEVQTSSKQQ